ncbi:mitochondrial import inner membrane translocase subunit Tim13-like [Diadema setosum]|uniref:mitochondrial import inner membrane translocase subunit Tim13-like n=1 Tax=Diadema setosum TaxID=31175 RepID=UPI003B3B1CC8
MHREEISVFHQTTRTRIVRCLLGFYFFNINKMDSFGSSLGGSPGSGTMDSAKKGQIMDEVRTQIALANAQELLQKMTDKCFKKCVYKPGTSLDSSEQKCIAMCMDRYMDSWNTVSKAYNARLQRERNRLT